MKATRGKKHPSEAKNDMKELIYWKNEWKLLSSLKNPLADPIRFELRPQARKIQWPPRSLYVHNSSVYIATRRACLEALEAGFLVHHD